MNDETRTMFINVLREAGEARDTVAREYGSSPPVDTFNIGDLVSLHIDAKYGKSTTPKPFCKVIRKPQPDMQELSYSVSIGYYPANTE